MKPIETFIYAAVCLIVCLPFFKWASYLSDSCALGEWLRKDGSRWGQTGVGAWILSYVCWALALALFGIGLLLMVRFIGAPIPIT